MKKLFALILAMLTLMLGACSNTTAVENGDDFMSEEQSEVPQNTEKNAFPEDFDFSKYDTVKDLDFMFALSKTEGIREYEVWKEDGMRVIEEVPNEKIWLISKNGEFLSEEPFEKYSVFENHPNPKWWVIGIRDGILYPFYVDENTGEIIAEAHWGPDEKEVFGYSVYKYYWHNHTPSYGIISPDGSVFAEPIYHKIEVPFEDRIILFNGNNQVLGLTVCSILNTEKEILSECFNYVKFKIFDDGSYIGVAMCGGNEQDGKKQLFDSKGDPMPDGFWFIDKDGTIISEHFQSLENIWDLETFSFDDTITGIDSEGNTVIIKIKDYIITP